MRFGSSEAVVLVTTMLAFLTSARTGANPLQSVKSASAWLDSLPPLDVMARTQLTAEALGRVCAPGVSLELGSAQALLHVDAALSPDRRKLYRQHTEGAATSGPLHDRIWRANITLVGALIGAYEAALRSALSPALYASWKALAPGLLVRLFHHYGTDAKLRIGRHDQWIPARWRSLHEHYARASDLGIERLAVTEGSTHGRKHTIEHEYLFTLALHLLDTGSFTAPQIEWAAGQVRVGSRKLHLTKSATNDDDFTVDLASDEGLVRGSAGRSAPSLRFLDTTPMIGIFDTLLAERRTALDADSAQGVAAREQVGILEKLRVALATGNLGELRRDPREECSIPARVRVGLAPIYRLRKGQDVTDDDEAVGANIIAIQPRRGVPYPRTAGPVVDTLGATLAIGDHTLWQVKDRSVSGLRIVTEGALAPGLALGSLIAVRQSDTAQWRLGIIRRLKKVSSSQTELGMSLIAERFKAIRLRPKRSPNQDTGIAIEGPETALLGPAIESLYLPPPSRHHKPVLAKSVIIAASDYAAGRELILTTERSRYTVALRSIIEQRGEWCWATLSIVDKEPRAAPATPA